MMLLVSRKIPTADTGRSAGLPPALTRYLGDFVLRQRVVELLRATGRATAILLGWTLLACLLDRFLQLSFTLRLALLVAGITAAVVIVARRAARFLSPIDYHRAAARVEQINPAFGERLRTVVSQPSTGGRLIASSDFLGQLTDQVLSEAQRHPPARSVAWSAAARPWGAAGALLALLVLTSLVSGLEMPILVKRLALPLSNVPPVTTTRLSVQPGNVSLNRGAPLSIRARVHRLSDGGVDIYTSEDGSTWTRVPMLPVSDDEYVFTLSAVDRDLKYYLSGGDATTPVYEVDVLRAPAVIQYQLRYEYPLYTQREPISVTSNDAVIDAVVGTRVQVQVQATEPLRSAVLTIGDRTQVMSILSDPRSAEAYFVVEKSVRADLQLTSSGGLSSGTLRGALAINAVPDREPMARILQPLDDLRLHPRDVVGIQYQAMDDYGVLYLAAVVQSGSGEPRELPIRRRGDLRRLEGEYFLDLAALNVQMGDVVSVSLLAQDGLGRRVQTEPRNFLISPRSIDVNTYLRIAETRQAAQLAASARDDLRSALASFEQAIRRADRSAADTARSIAGARVTAAVENSLLLQQALLRAVARSASPQQTLILAHYVDRATTQVAGAERIVAMDAAGDPESAIVRLLRPMLDPAVKLAAELSTLGNAEQAAAVLADRANVRVPSTQPADKAAAERLAETLGRARQEIAAAVQELGLDPQAGNLDALLRLKVDAGARLAPSAGQIDFAKAAEAWIGQLRRSVEAPIPLADRLSAAASVEAVRPDSNPIIARDLQLASRATTRLLQSMLSWPEADRVFIPHPVDEYPMALRSLQREHALLRTSAQPPAASESRQVAADAAAARTKLAEWASRIETSTGSEIAGDIMDEEQLAMVASAETAQRRYDEAAQVDRRLAASADSPEEAGRLAAIGVAMGAVQEIDRLATDQKNLAAQTEGLHDEERAAAMARDQENIARQIELFHSNVGSPEPSPANAAAGGDSRRRATDAVQRVQEQLAHMPQRLAVAQDAADNYRAAVERADQARWRAEGADDEQRPAAERAVDLADRAAREAHERLLAALAHVRVEVIRTLAAGLEPFQPEAATSVETLSADLAPAAEAFERVALGGERPSVSRAAQRVRTAIEAAQLALSDAQARLIESDPVVSAHWFAQAAARALAERPPDVPRAHRHQATAATALERAWQNSVRDLSRERLSLAPGYRAILRSGSTAQSDTTGVFQPLGELIPGLRQWGFLRGSTPSSLAAPIHDSSSPGYQEQLRIYFETLSKAQQRQQEKPPK